MISNLTGCFGKNLQLGTKICPEDKSFLSSEYHIVCSYHIVIIIMYNDSLRVVVTC